MYDLHTHSYCSDGTDSPELVAEKAAALGCTLFALTDHDTMSGVAAAKARAKELDLPFLTGCEIEAKYEDTLHILALGVDGENPALRELLTKKEINRIDRNRRLGERLAELGMDVSSALVESRGSTTRANYAAALVKLGYARDLADAFDRILKRGCPAYVSQEHPSPEEVIGTIHAAGGTAVIAHPMKMKKCDPGTLIADMARLGIDGVEAFYSTATEGQTKLFSSLAREHGLLVTCGSDYHGGMRSYAPLGGAWRVSADLVKSEKILLNRYVR
ncbi:MAG: PHP domain-containing protein [Clostridia bacterium]|nr:PHP domain-containing protein [Clostridia bacterium]